MSQALPVPRIQLAPEVEARILAWMRSDTPMDIANDRERDACVELLRRLGEQPATTPEDLTAVLNLKRLTEAYTARQVRYCVPITPEAAIRLQAKREERQRTRNEKIAAGTQPTPRSGVYADWCGHQRLFIQPEPGMRYACPCCGFLTLPERNGYDLCPVCFWEDDGQDDHDADEVRGGPNHDLSLTKARRNFAEFGACEGQHTAHVRAPLDCERPSA